MKWGIKWHEYKMINLYFQQSHIELYDLASVYKEAIYNCIKAVLAGQQEANKIQYLPTQMN